ncbi:unnamed protein product [Miscanthus lutarioriparius]|uniref:Uncharacterized protein n=1 Tax=Miscanthus lutarioriparius TaxID=422564 RepID=A0A811PIH3_9POAL|nr:unnamed protein product [Miscanthus lutarioriparius]
MAGKRVTGGDGREEDGAMVGLPSLDLSLAFPQATPASIFPPSASDYYQFDDLLTSEERSIREKVRGIVEKEIAPIMAAYWEKAEFPFHAIPKLASLSVAGGTIKGYGCPGLSITASAVTMAEMARVDASCSTFILVHSSLAMVTIALCGSEAQKQKYLPSLAQLTTVGCWALTEPNYGSDASSLRTTATKAPGGWHIDGQKRWIGNSTFADVLVVLARNADTQQLNGFIVRKGAPGLKATKIENKIGLRMVQNGDIVFNMVFVPEEDRLPGITSFQDISKAWNSRMAREVVSLGRELLGGNGILADFLVAKAFCDLEPIYSYEGTYDINSLVTGREITGIASFKPAALAKARL